MKKIRFKKACPPFFEAGDEMMVDGDDIDNNRFVSSDSDVCGSCYTLDMAISTLMREGYCEWVEDDWSEFIEEKKKEFWVGFSCWTSDGCEDCFSHQLEDWQTPRHITMDWQNRMMYQYVLECYCEENDLGLSIHDTGKVFFHGSSEACEVAEKAMRPVLAKISKLSE